MDTAQAGTSPTTSIRVFGGVGVDAADGPVGIGGPRQRRLLALLAARAGNVVSIDWLAEYLWDDADRPDVTAPAIRTYLSRLRQALPGEAEDWVETAPSGYRLAAPDEAVEHLRFGRLRAAATEAREGEDPQRALDLLDEALGLWRGDPFRELEDVDWAWAEVEQLRLDRLEMQEERWEAALALGRHTQITGELAAFTAEHGERDRAVRQHALALHRSGRTPDALRVIAEHRRRLAEQSGLDPSPAMLELERALLAGDSSLEVEKVGRPLRGYRLLEQAGVGAFSVVWRGVQPSVEREVAVKQIRAELATQPEFIRRFEAEAHLVARLEHPHIVPLIDYWRDPDSAYLVMRWLRGGTLERRLDDGPLGLDASLALACQLGGALGTAHAHGVIHRDVKTANILFDEQGHAFLGDFGIALAAADTAGPAAKLSPGSPVYAAPEQLRGEKLGPAADVFSLGVVIYECLRGSLPFPDSTSVEQMVDRQMNAPYPSLRESGVDVPRTVSDAIARATAKDPSQRYATMQEFVDALTAGTAVPAGEEVPPVALVGEVSNPYVGLRAFDDADADRFFGRERLVGEITRRLGGSDVTSRCVVIVGPSGSGKSSVARAGVVPALRAGGVAGSADWFFTSMVPGSNPFEALETALLRVAVNPPDSLLGQLRDGPRGVLRSVRRCLVEDGQRLVLLLDQFEEVFTGSDHAIADAFLEALTVAVTDPATPLRLVATLRADYYDRPLEHPAFAPLLIESAVGVTPLAADELEQAIVEPARRVGVGFEPGLVARLSAEAVGQASPLPLLQYTLSELFDLRGEGASTLTIAGYDELGGLAGALAARAETIYGSGEEAQRAATRRVFGRLISPAASSADLRRRARRADLGDDEAVTWVLAEFGAARLLTFDREEASREPTVEVAHEALLREWPRLVGWLDEDRELLRTTDAIAAAADTWHEGGRQDADLYRGGRLEAATAVALASPDRLRSLDAEFVEASRTASSAELEQERRRVRRLRRLVVGVAAALVVALVAGAIALREQNRADDERAAAQAAAAESARQAAVAEQATADAELATLISRSAANIADNPEASMLLALEANRRAPSRETEQAVLNSLGGSKLATPIASHLQLFEEECPLTYVNSAGTYEHGLIDGRMVRRHMITGEVTEHGTPPEPCLVWFGDTEVDRQVTGDPDGRRFTLGPFGEPPELVMEFRRPTWPIHSTFLPTGYLPMAVETADGIELRLMDWSTGEWAGDGVLGGTFEVTTDATTDGRLVAASFFTPDEESGDLRPPGQILLVDGMTGELIHVVESDVPANELEFDEARNQLLAGTFEGRLMTIDVDTGEVIHDIETPAPTEVLLSGVRDDGSVVVVSSGSIDVVDRASGAPLDSVAIRNAIGGRYRADGRLVVFNADGTTDVIDPETVGSALPDSTYDVDRSARVAFHDGYAGVLTQQTGEIEIVELESGDREAFTLELDGEPYLPAVVHPDEGGFWTAGHEGLVIWWEDGQPVHRLDLGASSFTGTLEGDWWAVLTGEQGGDARAHLIRLDPDGPEVTARVGVVEGVTAHPTGDGGMHVLGATGRLQTFDADGVIVDTVETGVQNVEIITRDVASGKLALASGLSGVAIVDPATGEKTSFADSDFVSNLGFARDGEYLVVTGADGTVRLWDLERMESAGLLFDGRSAVVGSPSWYDPRWGAIWVSTSGRLLQIPLDPEVWVLKACNAAGRELTADEWERLVPGDQPQQPACS